MYCIAWFPLQELTDGLPLLPPTLTLHLELASMANERFVSGVVAKVTKFPRQRRVKSKNREMWW